MSDASTTASLDALAALALAGTGQPVTAPGQDASVTTPAVDAAVFETTNAVAAAVADAITPDAAKTPLTVEVPAVVITVDTVSAATLHAFGDGDVARGLRRLLTLARLGAVGPIDATLFGSVRLS